MGLYDYPEFKDNNEENKKRQLTWAELTRIQREAKHEAMFTDKETKRRRELASSFGCLVIISVYIGILLLAGENINTKSVGGIILLTVGYGIAYGISKLKKKDKRA